MGQIEFNIAGRNIVISKEVSDAEKAEQILLKKVIRDPRISGDQVGALIPAIKNPSIEANINLSEKEIAILERSIPKRIADKDAQEARLILDQILREQKSRDNIDLSRPETLAQRISSYTPSTETLMNVTMGTMIMGAGAGLASVGIYGVYETVNHAQQLGLMVIPVGLGTGLITTVGSGFTIIGQRIFSNKF